MRGNVAAEGAGIALTGGSRLTARQCWLAGNAPAGMASASGSGSHATGAAAGADLLLLDGANSAAYFEPLPEAGELSGGSVVLLGCCLCGHHVIALQGVFKTAATQQVASGN